MLTVPLFPLEFVAMLGFMSRTNASQLDVPIRQQPVPVAVLMEFQCRLSLARIFAWQKRSGARRYMFNMPVHVGLALYNELQKAMLTADQQSLLAQLDQALTNYRIPMDRKLILTTNLLHAATA